MFRARDLPSVHIRNNVVAGLCALAGCASPEPVPAPAASPGGILPGTIGVLVQRQPAGMVVEAVGKGGPAAAAGLRAGDIVLRYNGIAVASSRQFYQLVLESAPGSLAVLEVLREGARHRIDIPVGEIDTALRV